MCYGVVSRLQLLRDKNLRVWSICFQSKLADLQSATPAAVRSLAVGFARCSSFRSYWSSRRHLLPPPFSLLFILGVDDEPVTVFFALSYARARRSGEWRVRPSPSVRPSVTGWYRFKTRIVRFSLSRTLVFFRSNFVPLVTEELLAMASNETAVSKNGQQRRFSTNKPLPIFR